MSGADKSDCASWCALPADHEGTCQPAVTRRGFLTDQEQSDKLAIMQRDAQSRPIIEAPSEMLRENLNRAGLKVDVDAEIKREADRVRQEQRAAADTETLLRQRSQQLNDLLEAVRVRPNAKALKLLRDYQEAMEACGDDDDEESETDRIKAAALDTLLQLADKITAVLKKHTTEGG